MLKAKQLNLNYFVDDVRINGSKVFHSHTFNFMCWSHFLWFSFLTTTCVQWELKAESVRSMSVLRIVLG